MTEIIDFKKAKEEREPHISGQLYCMACNHDWTAVWKPGTQEFECPQCNSMKGRSKYDIMPAPGSQVWTCMTCDNQLFNLLADRVHCPNCGNAWGYEEMGE